MNNASRHLTDEQTQQVRDLWGDQLQPIPADLLGAHVPAATRIFLTTVGLPTVDAFGTSFYHDDRLSVPAVYAGRDYLVVAEGGGGVVHYLVDSESDELREDNFPEPAPGRLVNSTLGHFILFLGIYLARIGHPPKVNWQDACTVAQELQERLRADDSPAVGATDTWWNLVLDEIYASGA